MIEEDFIWQKNQQTIHNSDKVKNNINKRVKMVNPFNINTRRSSNKFITNKLSNNLLTFTEKANGVISERKRESNLICNEYNKEPKYQVSEVSE